jgi:short-subunit dehydrogenase
MSKGTIVITGASSGIGAATARQLAGQGYRVVLVARSREKLEELGAEIGDQAVVEALDASDGSAVISMASRVKERFGHPYAVVNSAGAGQWKRIEDTSPAEAKSMMDAPYFAAFNTTHAFMKGMLGRGSGVFIHVGSPASICTWPSSVGYAATRGALRSMHEALCDDLVGTGVASCHVLFGKVSSAYFDNNPGAEEKIPGIASTVRTIAPEECARVIVRTIERPRRQVVYPFVMRLYMWNHVLFPWSTRWLLRRTARGRHGS